MSLYVALLRRSLPNCGREKQDYYVHVVTGYQEIIGYNSLAAWLDANPTHHWNDSSSFEYAVELEDEATYNVLKTIGVYYDNFRNLPIWQQQATVTGDEAALGSYADPTNELSTFTLGTQVMDDRYIFRVFDQTPSHPLVQHVGDEMFAASTVLPVRYIEIYDSSDTVIDKNDTLYLNVGSQYLKLDFGTGHLPVLAGGVTSVDLDVSLSGVIILPSSYEYRFIGPDEGFPNFYRATIYSDRLRPVVD